MKLRPFRTGLVLVAVLATGCTGNGQTSGPETATTSTGVTITSAAGESTTTPAVPAPSTTATTSLPPPPPPGTPRHVPEFQTTRAGFGDPYDPGLGNGGLDVQHYTLDLSFEPEVDVLAGTVTIDAVATERLETFHLDFSRFEISNLLVDDTPADFRRDGKELIITPAAAIPTGEGFSVAVSYSGTPEPFVSRGIGLELGWLTDPDGDRFVITEPDGAHTWFPNNDHPLDKASYTFRITVPDPLIAAANGELVEIITDLGAATYVWEMDDPMATYLATVVIGDYEIVPDAASTQASGIEIRNVLPVEMTPDPPVGLELHGEMMQFFAERFGPYPFDEYGIVFVDDLPGALETQTLSVFGSDILDAPDQPIAPDLSLSLFEIVLVHELAHQWFGNNVSPGEWEDIWLNEGFASYAEFLWIEHLSDRSTMEAGINAERDFWADQDPYPPGTPPYTDLFGGPVYRLGAMTLHALRLTVGDAAFFDILRTYHQRFAGSTAFTEDFVAVAEEVSGRDLSELFDAWLYSPGVPDFPVSG